MSEAHDLTCGYCNAKESTTGGTDDYEPGGILDRWYFNVYDVDERFDAVCRECAELIGLTPLEQEDLADGMFSGYLVKDSGLLRDLLIN